MFKFIKKFKRKTSSHIFHQDNIYYIHHNPERGNIGDFLCSPRHYFTFSGATDLCIIGGGVFQDLGYKKIKQYAFDFKKSILWGAGTSIRSTQPSPKVMTTTNYALWGIRDINLASTKEHFLPCVSCMHSMLETHSNSEKTLLFINADPKVTEPLQLEKIKSICDEKLWTLLFNNCSEQALISALASHSKIVTNSYHGAYWGFLSGKTVSVMGYSSKFINLLSMFNIEKENLIKIERGCGDSLIAALKSESISDKAKKLDDARATLELFRKSNINFAEKVIKYGLASSYILTHK